MDEDAHTIQLDSATLKEKKRKKEYLCTSKQGLSEWFVLFMSTISGLHVHLPHKFLVRLDKKCL